MSQTPQPLAGFTIRPPREGELQNIHRWFGSTILGTKDLLVQVAFGQPGDVPLGAFIARPFGDGKGGRFQVFVRPDCRRMVSGGCSSPTCTN